MIKRWDRKARSFAALRMTVWRRTRLVESRPSCLRVNGRGPSFVRVYKQRFYEGTDRKSRRLRKGGEVLRYKGDGGQQVPHTVLQMRANGFGMTT